MEKGRVATINETKITANQRKIQTTNLETGYIQNLFQSFLSNIVPPIIAFIVIVGGWELIVSLLEIPKYILPKPSDIVTVAIAQWDSLIAAVWTTLLEGFLGFLLSVVLGVGGAILLASSKLIEKGIYPYAVILQTVPIVAVAPIIVIWFGAGINAIVVIAFLVGFFPMLSNTLIGLNSIDRNMKNLFYLYKASKFQTLIRLRIPAALPYIVAGLKISCTLAVVGAIVGEFIAGIGGGDGGLGYAITIASSKLQTDYLFACAMAASILGIVFFLMINAFSKWMLSSWHESEIKSDR